ncbi:MAG: sigma-70 family RNA polymerase sigma factor [Actinomycetota bacterium]|jgi:RNA polymerase sigma-70 factor (ECF subfamily)|nr:sigma-70 family RNA polymerase sigma factor [Actinomycetota bacterium]
MTETEFEDAFATLGASLLRYCAFRTGSHADGEDLAEETLARLFARLDRVDCTICDRWAFRVAHNLCTDHLRRARRRVLVADVPERETRDGRAWLDPDVEQALRKLSASDQRVVFLRAIEDLPFDRIAELDGRKTATVRMRYHRAMKTLRQGLTEASAQ